MIDRDTLVRVTGGTCSLNTPFFQVSHGVSIDTRTIEPGALFLALQGSQSDGHDFVEQARMKGAVAAVVTRQVDTQLPVVMVPDAQKALLQIGAEYRRQMENRCILAALTGSFAKTTVKTMVAWVLSEEAPTLASQKNYNNHLGVPLTLSQWHSDQRYSVLELGANHEGEIELLSHLVRPHVALITNVGPAHLEGFGSLEGIAQAKGEIFSGLLPGGLAIINADDAFASFWQERLVGHRVMTFGRTPRADVRAQDIRIDESGYAHFTLCAPDGKEVLIDLPLIGEHQVSNALACSAMCLGLDIPLGSIATRLATVPLVDRRLAMLPGQRGSRIIHDAYNANPRSVKAALDVLARVRGRKIFVFGDMLELGREAARYHEEIGQRASEIGLEKFYGYGELSRHAINAFSGEKMHFDSKHALIEALANELCPEVTILVKGSQGMKLEEVVNVLKAV